MSEQTLPSERQRAIVEAGFARANFVSDVGIHMTDCGLGWVEAAVDILPRHAQQNGFVHAGVQTTLADHTAGAAAGMLAPEGFTVLTLEFKVNLLRAAVCERLLCRAEVLKAGRQVSVVESEVFAMVEGEKRLFSKATVTMAVVQLPD
ncbi:PaaI family thioesterase [Halopseudomonas nanhaiensis]|uniref:PaaI family thioesterase n=1 Tax=Halopseudomonas nanhaiensis TaxID=2830842 RepID=UPI001CBE5574|nr:PaaI family thioesterase [Halopseudomonas nanhaiensis]UAW99200.1 PaaI family thioesterase [Halopseudomonas nanhaiensis]